MTSSQPRFPESRRQGIYVLPLCPHPRGPEEPRARSWEWIQGMGARGAGGELETAQDAPGGEEAPDGHKWPDPRPPPLGTPGPRPAPPLLHRKALTSGEVSRRRAPSLAPPSRRSGAPGRAPEDPAGPAPGQAPPSSQPRPAAQVTSAFSLASGPPAPALTLLRCAPETLRLRGPSKGSV